MHFEDPNVFEKFSPEMRSPLVHLPPHNEFTYCVSVGVCKHGLCLCSETDVCVCFFSTVLRYRYTMVACTGCSEIISACTKIISSILCV